MTPLTLAVSKGHLETVIKLVELDADVDATTPNGMAPIHFACKMGHFEIAHFLVEYTADLDATSREKLTPLHFAALEGHKEIVEYLVDQCDDDMTMINSKDYPDKHTPLHLAVIRVCMLAHFHGFEFPVRNEENFLLSHEKRGKFEESLNSPYSPNLKF